MSQDTPSYSILCLPQEERPRERLHRHGAEAMSTAELIAIILGSGMKGKPVLQLAHELVSKFGSLRGLAEATVAELCQVKGLGVAKAIQLKAAFSLGIRLSKQEISPRYRIESPIHAYNLIKDELETEKRELFVVILMDIKGYVIMHQVVSIGSLSQTIVHPREVFYPAIRHKAASLILGHNHPSGDPSPSQEDYEVTEALIKVGKVMSIPVQDHLIIGVGSFVSLKQKGFAF
jgi:DNA repair protein RadC